MNSRILLIAFATISYLSVTKSEGLGLQAKDVPVGSVIPPRVLSSSPLPIHRDTVTEVPQIIQPNKTDVKIEIITTTKSNNSTSDPVTSSTTLPTNSTTLPPANSTTLSPSSTTTPKKPVIIPTNATTTTTTSVTITTNSTLAPSSSQGTTTTVESTTSSISGHERQFDGPSFIGGIVLTVGLTAIGFIAFKFCKAGKFDLNYRTL